MRFLSAAKSVALASIAALTRRHAVLLPRESSSEDLELRISTTYRVDLPYNVVTILESSPGSLDLTLLGYEGSFPRRTLWSLRDIEYSGPSDLILNIETGVITFGNSEVGRVPGPLPGRRFAWRLTLRRPGGKELGRLTSHYTPGATAVVAKSYYHGDDYVDYDAQAAGEADQILPLLRDHGAGKRLLEIGSATGLVLDRLIKEGFDAVGIDFSEWAVGHARATIGDGKVFLADVEHEPVPDAVVARAPFDTLLLWAVLEHFHDPFAVLEKAGASCGARIVAGDQHD